ncbi:MAG: radical SAM protein [Conexivisphaerales archaeon]
MLTFSLIKDGVLRLTDYEGTVLSLDFEGRVLVYAKGGTTYRRTMQNRYLEIRYIDGKRNVKVLGSGTGREIGESAFEYVSACRENVQDDSVKKILEHIVNKGPRFLEEDAKRFVKVYGGEIPIVPPDQYFPVYLQATVGCYWNQCTFCNLYRGKKYSVRNPDEFREHLSDVKEFFGRGLSARRGVFLGDANSIILNQDLLRNDLLLIQEELRLPVYSFVDSITTQKVKTAEDLLEISRLGVRRIYLGLETGSGEVLKLLTKPIDLSSAGNLIIDAKRAGISVGIITLAGAGGKKYYREHVEKTAEFISHLPLDRNDIVYISPLYIYQALPYAEISHQVGELSRYEEEEQAVILKSLINEKYRLLNGSELRAPVAPYDLVESIY